MVVMSSTQQVAGLQHPPFTSRGLRAGAIGVWPIIPGLVMYGAAFGVMAGTAGLSTLEATLMSGWVHAGGAQMASLQAQGYRI
jgi:predicted branched-subunit amino acid permease